jgi:hypothetical protein
MPVAVVFRCELCGRRPCPETQANLERQLLDLRHGEYLDGRRARTRRAAGAAPIGPAR